MGNSVERATAPREDWNEWGDVLEWVLLSEGGHNTAPHMDSHGLATWITAQEGRIGFGWMSRPTQQELNGWMSDPRSTEWRWRHVILNTGETVFFNSGTIHFVFKLRKEQTLALGGHVLQWSNVERWVEIVEAQLKNLDITNEVVEWSSPRYDSVVAKLVSERRRRGLIEELGGEAAVQNFFASVEGFDGAI